MRKQRILALDLGSTAFKRVLLEVQDPQRIQSTRVVELPVAADPATRVAALKELVRDISLSELSGIVSVIDDPFACLRPVTTPPMPPAERPQAVRWQLQPFLAIPPEEAMVEVEPLEGTASDPQKQKFLAAAFPAASLKEHLNFLSQAGIQPTQLVPKEMAVAGWLNRQSPSPGGQTAVLELGGSGCEFMVFENGLPVFTRKIPGGGASLTREMTGVLMTAEGQVSLTEAEAEAFKRNIGIPNSPETSAMKAGQVTGAQLFSLMRGNLERLAMEAERSMAFYGESGGQVRGGELLLIGGGAHLKGLAGWLQERLGVAVRVPVPEGGDSEPASSGIPAWGAALTQGRGMNFLPAELRHRVGRDLQRVAFKGIATALLLGAVLLRAGLFVSRQSLLKQISAFQLEQQAVAPQLEWVRPSLTARTLAAAEPDWSETLRALSRITPAEIHLVDLNLEARTVLLRGRVHRGARRPDEVLGLFMQVLTETCLDSVTLRSSRLTDSSSGQMEFEVSGELR